MDGAVTIEHLMPQTLTDEWRQMLGETWREDHPRWLHTIGNLTLSAYNSELGQKSFEQKKAILKDSHFELNRWVLEQAAWDAKTIKERAAALADRACCIWQRPQDSAALSTTVSSGSRLT